ncbi:hypothetical protein PAHAL_5G371300 [Panicum hallii]|uniref:Uncharacterized protein n=1 Tax=Panicum hallii TaxID=206008 RepID=A0A2T8IMI0_9POAL|nr:hypothetical protein PAHAL_5G371300 [Panicum hallii]
MHNMKFRPQCSSNKRPPQQSCARSIQLLLQITTGTKSEVPVTDDRHSSYTMSGSAE